MKLERSQLQHILDALSSLRNETVGIGPREIQDLCKKICKLRNSLKDTHDQMEVTFTEREKDIFAQVAKEILMEKHFAYWELPAVAGGTKEELTKRWGEVAKLMGRKL